MPRINLKGVHIVRKKLANGDLREYHYAYRGGPKFWSSDMSNTKGGAEYIKAYTDSLPDKPKGIVREILIKFLDSPDFIQLSERYKKDIKQSIFHPQNGIDEKFGSAPTDVFNYQRIRAEVFNWCDSINSPKVATDRLRHLQKVIKWAFDRGAINQYHLRDIKSRYTSGDRAELFWTAQEIDAFVRLAPPHVARILVALSETGLRPGDLYRLSRFHIETTNNGLRIVINTEKRKRIVSVPVTPRMKSLIDDTPAGQSIFLVGKKGSPYKHPNYLGDAVSTARDDILAMCKKRGIPAPFRAELRLYDARGSAANRLLRAGVTIPEIATAMGWSIKKAAEVLENYAALHPDMTDGLGEKIKKLESRTKV